MIVYLRSSIHYFNIPCDIEPDSPFNPLNIIKAMYKPGDFVVIKLDIDNEPVEQVGFRSTIGHCISRYFVWYV